MDHERYAKLTGADRIIALAALRPAIPVYAAALVLAAFAWLFLAFMAAGIDANGGGIDAGPGAASVGALLSRWFGVALDTTWLAYLIALCTPGATGAWQSSTPFVLFAMWFAMALAMMLPSAAPMLRTYGDISDVAVDRGEDVVPIGVLLAGYLAVWVLFCAVAAGLQTVFIASGLIDDPLSPATGFAGAAVLLVAGLYQFSSLRHACLEKCRNPFPILFGRWSDRPIRIFRLGLEQGAYCVGCCWGLMLVMFAVGTMNIVWMAFLTLLTILEKSGTGQVTSWLSGGILLLWSGGLFLASALATVG